MAFHFIEYLGNSLKQQYKSSTLKPFNYVLTYWKNTREVGKMIKQIWSTLKMSKIF